MVTWAYGTVINVPADPTREWYKFEWWDGWVPETMPAENKTIYAKWSEIENKPSWWSSWWGGWSSSTSDSQTDSNKTTDNEKANDDSNTNPEGDNSEDLDGLEVVNYNPELPAEQQTLSDGLTPEMHEAYKWAYKNGITNKPTILEADMYGPLDRISMAKMLSTYAIKILWMTPDTGRVNQFADVTPEWMRNLIMGWLWHINYESCELICIIMNLDHSI